MITHASLFSGFGAADLAATWMGWSNAFWCEIGDFQKEVLRYWFPNSKGYENIKETDFTEQEGKIDVLTGGFPCQPFSVAGKRKGKDDDRYLWPEMLRAIREIRPSWVVGENVAGIISMVQSGSEVTVESQTSLFEKADKETILEQEYIVESICRDLEREGYSVQSVVIPACSVGAPHRRDRVWFIANRTDTGDESLRRKRENKICKSGTIADTDSKQLENAVRTRNRFTELTNLSSKRTWKDFPTFPPVCRRDDGLPFDVDHLTVSYTRWRTESIKGYGNAIVPQVIYEIFKAIEMVE